MEEVIKKILEFANKTATTSNDNDDVTNCKMDLFEINDAKKISMQIVLHKIQNLKNDKQILCKLPNPIYNLNKTDACLIVKDSNKKSRDYDKTIRDYETYLKDNNLDKLIKNVFYITSYQPLPLLLSLLRLFITFN